MRQSSLSYSCCGSSGASQLTLYVDDWRVKHYPLTYTALECLEDWCEEVGWKFKSIRFTFITDRVDMWGGRFYFEFEEMEDVTGTVENYWRVGHETDNTSLQLRSV